MKPRSLFLLSSCIASAVMVHAVATPFTNEEAPIDPDNMKCKLNTYFTALTSPVLTSLEGKCVFSRSKDQCEKGVALFQTLNPEEICVDDISSDGHQATTFATRCCVYIKCGPGGAGTCLNTADANTHCKGQLIEDEKSCPEGKAITMCCTPFYVDQPGSYTLEGVEEWPALQGGGGDGSGPEFTATGAATAASAVAKLFPADVVSYTSFGDESFLNDQGGAVAAGVQSDEAWI